MLIFATGAGRTADGGALFYAARIPVTAQKAQTPAAAASAAVSAPRVLEVVTHPEFALPDISGVDA